MREHQIVITLKPEQFLEVQRLARASNAKSMGMFVRQQLLAALGIEGAVRNAAAADHAVADLVPVAGELKRLHSELKTFVAESLSMYVMEVVSNVESGQMSQADEQSVNQRVSMDSPVMAESEDFLEQTAEKTFAISPRLGAIGEDITGRDIAGRDAYAVPSAISEKDPRSLVASLSEDIETDEEYQPESEPESYDAGTVGATVEAPHVVPTVEQVALYEPASTVQQEDIPVLNISAKHDPHSRREIHRYHQNAAKDVMDVPFGSESESRQVKERYEEAVVSTDSRDVRLRRDASEHFVAAPATSSLFDDPLEKLLDGAENGLPRRAQPFDNFDDDDEMDEDDQDLFDVPLSIAERNRQLAAEKVSTEAHVQPVPVSEEADDYQRALIEEQASPSTNATAGEALAENTVSENSAVNEAPVPPEAPKPSTGRPLGYPPVSGNPPPKRRQV
jgi:hypothetical protein